MSIEAVPQLSAAAVRGMRGNLQYEERRSDSPLVERVWRTRSHDDEHCIAIADGRWDLMLLTHDGETRVLITGPQTTVVSIPQLAGSEWVGIRFRLGVTLPHIPLTALVNEGIQLPSSRTTSFSLRGASWQLPTYDNADTFVDRLIADDTLVPDPVVMALLRGEPAYWSARTLQYRFRQSTGLTQKNLQQIERAQTALVLLQQGVSVADTVFELGYYDHAHLANGLRRFIGLTPSEVRRAPAP